MSLTDEIRETRTEIHSDAYSMSVGELVNLYKDGELNIHPEFQRIYRWSQPQKSSLIESILLGIPLPSIFVAQGPDGVWDVIDGVQRLSTIFQFLGVLKDENEQLLAQLPLTKTKYLPSLEKTTWEDNDSHQGIGVENQLLIKRSKIDVKIILRESSESSKYELFRRLNSLGTQLSDQELRNVLILMADREFYQWLLDLVNHNEFNTCIALSDQAIEKRYNMELAVRFLAFRDFNFSTSSTIGDIGQFLDEFVIEQANSEMFDKAKEMQIFSQTFELLERALGEDSFRRYDPVRKKYHGGFLISAFETLAISTGYQLDRGIDVTPSQLREISKSLWGDQIFLNSTGAGINASRRISAIIPHGRKLLGDTNVNTNN